MQFTEQTITILNRRRMPEEIKVMVGDDSGLGYYLGENGYTITTTHSGYAVTELGKYTTIFNAPLAYNEQVAQQFIKTIMHLLDWKNSYEQIIEQVVFCYGDRSRVGSYLEQAFKDACLVMTIETSK